MTEFAVVSIIPVCASSRSVSARIIVNTVGEVVEEEDNGFKVRSEDGWRTISNTTPAFIALGDNPAGSFHLTGSSDVQGFITKQGKFLWPGREFVIKTDQAVTLKASTFTDTSNAKHWTFAEDYALKADSLAIIKEKGGELLVIEMGADVDISNYVDKFLHYWDTSLGRWFTSGLKFVAGVVNQLEFTGRIKADSIVLPANSNAVVHNQLRSDGNRLKYSDNYAAEKDIAYLTDISGLKIIKTYQHIANREVFPSNVNYTTSRITSIGHGFTHSGVKLVGLFLNNYAANINGATPITTDYQNWDLVNSMPFEWLFAECWLKVIDVDTLEVCNSLGAVISVNPTSSQNNGRLDYSKWHIEDFAPFSFQDIPPGYKNVEIRLTGMAINRNYQSAGQRVIGVKSYLPDYSIIGSNYNDSHSVNSIIIPRLAANNNINSVFFISCIRLRTSNNRFVHREVQENNRYWGGSLGNEASQNILSMSSGGETLGIAGLYSMTNAYAIDNAWFANNTIIEIYSI